MKIPLTKQVAPVAAYPAFMPNKMAVCRHIFLWMQSSEVMSIMPTWFKNDPINGPILEKL